VINDAGGGVPEQEEKNGDAAKDAQRPPARPEEQVQGMRGRVLAIQFASTAERRVPERRQRSDKRETRRGREQEGQQRAVRDNPGHGQPGQRKKHR
jgi:hypothetical protein